MMGFCKKYTEFEIGEKFNYVGIRFFPTVFPVLFKVNAKELSNNYSPLQPIASETSNFIASAFSINESLTAIKNKLDSHLIELINAKETNLDERFKNALQLILKNFGVINVQTELNVGLSPRQLRRYFDSYIGTTAKSFSQVIRFQNILRAKPSSQSLKNNKIFYELGYYDQAHFIKEFKKFYGVTPAKAFAVQ